MTIDIENGRRFNEEPLLAAVNSGDDIILVEVAGEYRREKRRRRAWL